MTKVINNNNEVHVYDENSRLIGYGGITRDSPLSNSYMRSFKHRSMHFYSTQHAITYIKARGCVGKQGGFLVQHKLHPAELRELYRYYPESYAFADYKGDLDRVFPYVLKAKFSQNKDLKKWLISTGNAVLAQIALETNNGNIVHHSEFWGLSIGPSNMDIQNPHLWHLYGNNYLGKSLMKLREEFLKDDLRNRVKNLG
jgi:predicted NAD-dependent protein-ADP-ribosyltransferase YbiA (DUF1768 family)